MTMAWQTGGVVLAGAGLATLYLAWKRKTRFWPLVLGGWSLIAASLWSWAQVSSAERGIALGTVAAVLLALGLIGARAISAPVKARRQVPQRLASVPDPALSGQGWRAGAGIAAMIVLALFVSAGMCTALFMLARSAGMEHTANLTMTMFAFPLLLAALTTFVAYAEGGRTKAMSLAGLGLGSAVAVAATMGSV
ncbi:hypothetical protein Ga0102493_111873 [Erythrobacter litoralis]|jgi:hypothetical protein|uniref:hypothetical protein n=1 Tax=Erythrobacter litoralis TaxID=39960 RepID=UPI000845D4B5|nr:hypothetical protein [Erythrobacter litoralis]AOL22894.1 hypothetical protein Ga0102493_111873 [Erythrobacter litoralis]